VPIPDHIDLYHLREEAEPTERSGLQSVVDEIVNELARLQKLEQHIMETCGSEDERLEVAPARSLLATSWNAIHRGYTTNECLVCEP
jgi:hypothetical protein